jgi:hypothetical protein
MATALQQPERLEPYAYQPLDLRFRQIRLIRLHDEDGITHYDICTFELYDAPEYIALSYTWESQTRLTTSSFTAT